MVTRPAQPRRRRRLEPLRRRAHRHRRRAPGRDGDGSEREHRARLGDDRDLRARARVRSRHRGPRAREPARRDLERVADARPPRRGRRGGATAARRRGRLQGRPADARHRRRAPRRRRSATRWLRMSERAWWRDAVFYEIYVRSFADSDGDGVGDLPGSARGCRTCSELGVDAIWLTPFYPSPGADHGYDVADYIDVDPQFGTLADFDELLADAHELGLRVTSTSSRTTPRTSTRGSGTRSPTRSPDRALLSGRAERRAAEQLAVERSAARRGRSTSGRGEYYLHLFAPEQPDLDWHNPAGARGVRARSCASGSTAASTASGSTSRTGSSRTRRSPTRPSRSRSRRSRPTGARRSTSRRCTRSTAAGGGSPTRTRASAMLVGEIVFSEPERVAPYVAARRAAPGVQLHAPLPAVGRGADPRDDRRRLRALGAVGATRDVGAREPRRHAA